ncbi:SDR family NAD(P)-dependent oxidoreductase [Candidatus Villigracilis affinis]|uniref:SDR family NAD(P)-dependent oxidoreductase n=1 Tax=Candidatus Villigracilis affinis TaxID=3140682 RepID=UPI002A1EA45B|nr:SDR family NAD(P)-dependent oxidoreductase [Anaerolineales bacterium]
MQSVVVTGVSTGIGWGITKILIQNGYRVFGSVRKTQDAERLQSEFGETFVPLIFDVTDEEMVHAAARQVRDQLNGETLFGLVNNAGVAVPAPLAHMPIDEFRTQMEINLTGQLIVTQAFLPLLGMDRSLKGKPGRLINMSSTSGKRGAPFVGAYVTSKHALEGMSETLRIELMLYGIDVIIIGPGAVATPIWDKGEQADLTKYQHTEYVEAARKFQKYMVEDGRKGLPSEKIGEVVLHALTTSKPRVRYPVVPNMLKNWIIPMLLPKRYVDRLIAKGLGFRK